MIATLTAALLAATPTPAPDTPDYLYEAYTRSGSCYLTMVGEQEAIAPTHCVESTMPADIVLTGHSEVSVDLVTPIEHTGLSSVTVLGHEGEVATLSTSPVTVTDTLTSPLIDREMTVTGIGPSFGLPGVIQTDGSVFTPGDSGSPLLDSDGHVAAFAHASVSRLIVLDEDVDITEATIYALDKDVSNFDLSIPAAYIDMAANEGEFMEYVMSYPVTSLEPTMTNIGQDVTITPDDVRVEDVGQLYNFALTTPPLLGTSTCNDLGCIDSLVILTTPTPWEFGQGPLEQALGIDYDYPDAPRLEMTTVSDGTADDPVPLDLDGALYDAPDPQDADGPPMSSIIIGGLAFAALALGIAWAVLRRR